MAKSRGLTWLEVLGILVILLVVAAVIFPILARNKKPVDHPYCLSNLKQLGTAISFYTQDWNGKYPLTLPGGMFSVAALNNNTTLWGASPTGFTGWTWGKATIQDLLSPYVKNKRIFICPKVGKNGKWYVNRTTTVRVRANHSAHSSLTTSYIYNGWCLKSTVKKPAADGSNEVQISGQNENICKNPGEAALMWDMVSGFRSNRDSNAQTAHDDAINVLYADGHAKTLVMRENTAPWNNTPAAYNGHFWGAPSYIDPTTTNGAYGWF